MQLKLLSLLGNILQTLFPLLTHTM